MNELQLISLPFYTWKVPDNLLNRLLENANNLKYKQQGNNLISESLNDVELINFIETCLLDLKNKLYPESDNINLRVTQCWANKTTFLGKHHKHLHSNSIFSGIIYLTSHDSGHTRFFYPNIFYHHEFNNLIRPTKSNNEHVFEILPNAGNLVVFPSHLMHDTAALKTNETRYTISFNTFFSGSLGSDSLSTALNLDIKLSF